jgi:hypothetical protein
VKNINDADTTAVTGARWHAQSDLGSSAQLAPRNGAMRVVAGRYAVLVTPTIAVKATAKQAPQSRGSSAHT